VFSAGDYLAVLCGLGNGDIDVAAYPYGYYT